MWIRQEELLLMAGRSGRLKFINPPPPCDCGGVFSIHRRAERKDDKRSREIRDVEREGTRETHRAIDREAEARTEG